MEKGGKRKGKNGVNPRVMGKSEKGGERWSSVGFFVHMNSRFGEAPVPSETLQREHPRRSRRIH